MTAQGYKSYADKFAELSAQLHQMELNALKHAFIKGLNAEFRQQVMLQGAKDLRGAQVVEVPPSRPRAAARGPQFEPHADTPTTRTPTTQ